MLEMVNEGFQFIIGLGGAAITTIFIILISLVLGVKLSKAIESGLKMGLALTGMGAIIGLLTEAFGSALQAFVQSIGADLGIVDLGWAQMAVVTWGSAYTMIFAVYCFLLNFILYQLKQTDTLNVDLFNIWHISIIGMLSLYYTDSLIITMIFVTVIYIFMLINADLMKPKLNILLDYEETDVTATAHPAFLMNPMVMFLNTIISKVFPSIDKYDFDAETINKKIGFWGSSFAIGIYLGIFVGVIGQQPVPEIISMAFIAGVSLELFGVIGGWFGPAMEPISQRIVDRMSEGTQERKINIGVDWAIIAKRPEIWAVANILAPILMIIAIILPGNKTLPLGGIILTALVPSLLFVTGGKVLRMTLMGTILIPLYLTASTAIAEFMTNTSIQMGVFPDGLAEGSLFTSIEAIPLEKIIVVLFGETYMNPNATGIITVILLIIVYIGLFVWYARKMKNKNKRLN